MTYEYNRRPGGLGALGYAREYEEGNPAGDCLLENEDGVTYHFPASEQQFARDQGCEHNRGELFCCPQGVSDRLGRTGAPSAPAAESSLTALDRLVLELTGGAAARPEVAQPTAEQGVLQQATQAVTGGFQSLAEKAQRFLTGQPTTTTSAQPTPTGMTTTGAPGVTKPGMEQALPTGHAPTTGLDISSGFQSVNQFAQYAQGVAQQTVSQVSEQVTTPAPSGRAVAPEPTGSWFERHLGEITVVSTAIGLLTFVGWGVITLTRKKRERKEEEEL